MANRKKQIRELQTEAFDLAEKVEALKDDLRESFDNMPESIQYSDRGQAAEERIDRLDSWLTELRNMAEEEDI